MNKSCIEQRIAEWIRHVTSTSVSPRLNYCHLFVILGPSCYCSSVWHQPCLEHCIHFRTWSLSAEELYTTRGLLPNSAVVCNVRKFARYLLYFFQHWFLPGMIRGMGVCRGVQKLHSPPSSLTSTCPFSDEMQHWLALHKRKFCRQPWLQEKFVAICRWNFFLAKHYTMHPICGTI